MALPQTKPRRRKRRKKVYERYEIDRSPIAQRPTQRDLAALVGRTQPDLRRLANYKELFIIRREIETGSQKKVRQLAYPEGWLRVVHERLKYHLNKVRQPDYLFSPRKNRGQRDNAAEHLDQLQYLTLDLKAFYPSTTFKQVADWLEHDLHMYRDVARLFAEIATVDGVVSFGSPLTPVLCTLVHRNMFSEIAELCDARGLRFSLWVDDLTISGNFVPGDLLVEIREIVRLHGHKTHKIKYRTGNRPVFITGIGVVGRHLIAPNSLNKRIKTLWDEFHAAETNLEKLDVSQRLLAQMGIARHIVGRDSKQGMKLSDQMNSLRQKRAKMSRSSGMEFRTRTTAKIEPLADDQLPW